MRAFLKMARGRVAEFASGGFAMAAHAVTNAQFGHFVRETGYATECGAPQLVSCVSCLPVAGNLASHCNMPRDTLIFLRVASVPSARWASSLHLRDAVMR